MSDQEPFGVDGEQLEAIASVLFVTALPAAPNRTVHIDLPYDPSALGHRVAPELVRWRERRIAGRVRSWKRSRWISGGVGKLFSASKATDRQRHARLQAIFLPVSSVRLHWKSYVSAAWHPTSRGASRVYTAAHEAPGWSRLHASLSGYLADAARLNPRTELSDADRAAHVAADEADRAHDDDLFPVHLDPERLEPRTRWIARLILGPWPDDDADTDPLQGLPPLAQFDAERTLLPDWPHLQAYWAVHHMLLGHHDLAAEALAHDTHRYPPLPELRALAEAFASGAEPHQLVGYAPHRALRWATLGQRPEALSADAVASIEAEQADHQRWRDAAATALGHLATHRDPAISRGIEAWEAIADAPVPDQDALRQRVAVGETSHRIGPMQALLRAVDHRWLPFFEATVQASAIVDEEHPHGAPGAWVGLGAALGSFVPLHERFQATCRSAGRHRFLELALVADHFYADDGAEAFLLGELRDFVPEIGLGRHGTTSHATFALLRRRHPEALELAATFLRRGPTHGAAEPLLVELLAKVRAWELGELRDAVQALGRREVGRPVLKAVHEVLRGG